MSDERFSDDTLRGALAEWAEIAGDGRECPDAERLVLSASGDLAPGGDEDVILHIARCTACAAAWRIARGVEGGATVRPPVAQSRFAQARWYAWAAAAVIVVLVAGGLLVLTPERAPAPVYREQGDEILRSFTPEDQPLSRDRFVLRWSPGPEGTVYDILVTSHRMDRLIQRNGLEETQFVVPESALDGVDPGSRLMWQVTALLPDGRRIQSRTFFVIVR
jgi:hypothetical protein